MHIHIEGWYKDPHSYAIVNCFQMYAIHKLFPEITFSVHEPPYYAKQWYGIQAGLDLYPEDMRAFLRSLESQKGKPDVIYRISFPYDIAPASAPCVVFYTSELGVLTPSYFAPPLADMEAVARQIEKADLRFTCPSLWSRRGLRCVPDDRSPIVPHGVSLDVYRRDADARAQKRAELALRDDELVFLHVGAMTQNKGTENILVMLLILTQRCKRPYRLVLKSSSSLYTTAVFLENYRKNMEHFYAQFNIDAFFKSIIVIHDTYSFAEMNRLYNACDVYLSAYLGEGFNLVPLEMIACGKHVLITDKGGSAEYVQRLAAETRIVHPLASSHVVAANGFETHQIHVPKTIEWVLQNEDALLLPPSDAEYDRIRELLAATYSWDRVAEQLVAYLRSVAKK